MSRFGRAVVVFVLIAGAGCGGSIDSNTNTSHLACARSVAELCAFLPDGCPLTWDEVESGQAACYELAVDLVPDAYVVGDCGAYRKLLLINTDSGGAFYYDATSGQLVAIVGGGGTTPLGCGGGPPEGFPVPDCPTADAARTRIYCPDAGGV